MIVERLRDNPPSNKQSNSSVKSVTYHGVEVKVLKGDAKAANGVPAIGICNAIKNKFKPFIQLLSEAFHITKSNKAHKNADVDRSRTPNELILPFYQNKGPDSMGRWISEIWGWRDAPKELCHDYIQWLFPLKEASGFNSNAPVLDETLLKLMKSDPHVIKNLEQSFAVMMKFYGFTYDEKNHTLQYATHFNERAADWLNPGNHNFLRLTRILKCLMNFGLIERAEALFNKLEQIHRNHPGVCEGAYPYWKAAVDTSAYK